MIVKDNVINFSGESEDIHVIDEDDGIAVGFVEGESRFRFIMSKSMALWFMLELRDHLQDMDK